MVGENSVLHLLQRSLAAAGDQQPEGGQDPQTYQLEQAECAEPDPAALAVRGIDLPHHVVLRETGFPQKSDTVGEPGDGREEEQIGERSDVELPREADENQILETAARYVLQRMNGRRSLEQIGRELCLKYPEVCEDPKTPFRKVLDLAGDLLG